MSSCSSEVDENAPIHTLPYETMRDLSRVLDGGDAWVELATWMPDITTQDVDGCRQFSSSHRGSPSEYLLRIWGSKGYSILSLYNLFAITRMVRCMRIIRHLLPESHHCLEEYDPSAESSSQPCFTPSAQQWKWNHVSLKARKEGHIQHALPVRATGSTQKSWVNPTTTESSSSGNMSDPIWSALQSTLIVPYTDLQEATSNFSDKNIVGKGGYGVVYVGEWKHTKIAVKRFMANGSRCGQIQRERLRQSLQELRTLAKFRHDNILPLYAFSLEGPEPCLVYQFMFNGSLEDRLSCRGDTPPLLWRQKREIAEGTARGLHFLHSIASVPIIHGDVKSANILLDKHFEPKLGDFGLSRDGRVEVNVEEKSPLIASHVKGTLAYLPPEFITNKILSTKIDVYSFGIVLLEIATGMRAFTDSRSPPSLADYCFSVVNRQKSTSVESSVLELMDNRTPSVDNQDGAMSWCKGIIYLGLQCANKDRLHRPSFPEILSSLSSLTFFELSMSKRLRRQRSRTTTNNVLRLDSRTFRCRSSSMVVMLLFPGERYCFYGAARIQCLAGELSVDSFKLPSDGQLDFDSMRLVCAPYRFSRPAVFRSRAIQEPFVKYKLNRLKYRLKEITPHYEVIMESIGDIYPAVLVLDYKPPPMVKVLDQILQEFLVPSSLRSPCQFDRTLFFDSEFQPYVEDSQRDLQVAMEEVNAKRKEGVRCTIVPVGRTRSGKSTLVRHLVNTNFQKEGPPIYILDADVGQSEFIPAGCMSLWKVSDGVLDVPCTHQKLIFPCCYFFGNVSPADDTERYKEIFDQLLNDFHSNSEPGSLLIINTLGWVDGLGAQLLEHIFDIARPCLAFSLSNDCGVFTIPRWVPKILRIYPMTATASCYLELPEKRPTSLQSSQLRDLTIISYFSSILPRPVLSSICDATPYSVNFKLITVCVPEDYSYVDDRYFLATLNVQIVALCSKSDGQSLETRRILSDDSLPLVSIIRSGSPILKCHGFGFNLETVEYRNVSFTVWDVGGQQRIRALWKYYFRDTDAIIFVVDSADRERIEEARQELHSLVDDPELRDTLLLVFANKQDMPNAMDATEVSKSLHMRNIRDREWYVQQSNAISGEGLIEGLEWLHSQLVKK